MLRTFASHTARAALACAATLIPLTAACGSHAHPHGAHSAADATGLSVAGHGEAKAAPDMARATVGIELRAANAEEATTQANQRMAAVLAALKSAGVAESDLRTNNFSISFERDYTPEPPRPVEPAQPKPNRSASDATRSATATSQPAPTAPEPVRGTYRASNTVEVVVRDLSRLGDVLGAASQAGANNVWGIQYELSNDAPLRAQARARAVERAQESAEQLAQLAGVKLGRIRAIEDMAGGGGPMMRMGALRAEAADAATVPVEQGELTITHEVRLNYALAH